MYDDANKVCRCGKLPSHICLCYVCIYKPVSIHIEIDVQYPRVISIRR